MESNESVTNDSREVIGYQCRSRLVFGSRKWNEWRDCSWLEVVDILNTPVMMVEWEVRTIYKDDNKEPTQ